MSNIENNKIRIEGNFENDNKIRLVDNIGNDYGVFARIVPEPPVLTFTGYNKEILRLEPNGDIFVKGRLVENDEEVVQGLRIFLASQGL